MQKNVQWEMAVDPNLSLTSFVEEGNMAHSPFAATGQHYSEKIKG